MIEVLSDPRCIGCDKCVEVCPTNVFEATPGGNPVISRQHDCQTCFMCEAYCPTDALFVSPLSQPAEPGSFYTDEAALEAAGRFGDYREWIGWGHGRKPGTLRDHNGDLTELVRQHDPAAEVL